MVGNMIPFLQMPNGGSIELELIPLMIASYHLGWKYGALCGLASFLLTIVLDVYKRQHQYDNRCNDCAKEGTKTNQGFKS